MHHRGLATDSPGLLKDLDRAHTLPTAGVHLA
jgi:hypothetical protein